MTDLYLIPFCNTKGDTIRMSMWIIKHIPTHIFIVRILDRFSSRVFKLLEDTLVTLIIITSDSSFLTSIIIGYFYFHVIITYVHSMYKMHIVIFHQ